MTEARAAVLGRVRAATDARAAAFDRAGEYAGITRRYQQEARMERGACLELFCERLREYGAEVHATVEAEIRETVSAVLRGRGLGRVLVAPGVPAVWQGGAEFVVDAEFSAAELDGFTGVMTAATLGIAETGTIVLQARPGQGRRAITLVPDYHLCVVRAADVVETVVEGMRWLEATRDLPTTFFSGPSATADIEMTRIKGVHGPRFVDVLLVDESGSRS